MTDFNWTSERDDELRAMRADGISMALAAAKLGCTRNSAIGRAHRLGIVCAPHKRSAWRRPPRRKPNSLVTPQSAGEVEVRKAIEQGYRIVQLPASDLPPEPPRRPGKRCTVFEVTGCRFIHGDPRDLGHYYCNAPRIEGLSWCALHARLCLNQYGGKD
jgi:hypothetical protein